MTKILNSDFSKNDIVFIGQKREENSQVRIDLDTIGESFFEVDWSSVIDLKKKKKVLDIEINS